MKKPTIIDKGEVYGIWRPESKTLDIFTVDLIKFPERLVCRTKHLIESISIKSAAAAVKHMDDSFANTPPPIRSATPEERVMTTASAAGVHPDAEVCEAA